MFIAAEAYWEQKSRFGERGFWFAGPDARTACQLYAYEENSVSYRTVFSSISLALLIL